MKKPKLSPVEEEHEEHIDERWLVSYADMMTLLFGLFVLLYAMRSPEDAKKMQESIQREFSENTNPIEVPKMVTLEELQKQIAENEELKAELNAAKQDVLQANRNLQNLISQNVSAQDVSQQFKQSLAALNNEKLQLEMQLEESAREIRKLKAARREIASVREQDSVPREELKDLEKKLKLTDEKLAEIRNKNDTLTSKNQALKSEIEELKTRQPNSNFLAIVLTWTTSDHDLDLVVTDPKGKKFNYKTKSFANYPGKIALDTRRGPGAEVWQADSVQEGLYEADIAFYNSYGNRVPAEAKLVVFSSRGSIELNDIKLEADKNSTKRIKFQISSEGKIELR